MTLIPIPEFSITSLVKSRRVGWNSCLDDLERQCNKFSYRLKTGVLNTSRKVENVKE
jgi:hypothetical protein